MISEIELDEKLYDELKLRSAKTGEDMLLLVNRYIHSGLMADKFKKPKSQRPKVMSFKERVALSKKKKSSEGDDIF